MADKLLGGRYEVQDKIGTGGMATVYRGRDEVLGRTVAIKIMLPQYANDPSFAARFKQEAQAAAALQSPYIVAVYDWGRDGETYYIVMEYLRGTDLKTGIRRHGALDCKKVAQIGSQIAQALSVAHKHGIIHRDIKPQNIMVQPDGNIKVMDFGIARAKNSHLTTDNSVLGTAHYVSPEQTQGKELGPTTDIYSLGIVMYESATGRVPFEGDDAITVALKQVNEQPKPPSELNPAVDPALEAIILKCMQKDPADRFQTADDLYHALRDYLAGRIKAVNGATATQLMGAQPTTKLEPGEGVTTTSAMPASYQSSYHPQSATQQAEEAEEERKHKKRRNTIIGVIVAIAVVVVIIVAVIFLTDTSAETLVVPNLLNYTIEEAEEILEEEGFVTGEVEYTYSDTVDEGLVCEQDPEANREAEAGSKINLYISKGSEAAETTEVPDLTGLTASAAESLLESYNLLGEEGDEEASNDIEEGLVCSQDVEAGESVSVGTTITYHISSGKGDVVVPNVVGDYVSTAISRLEDDDYGFTVETTYENSDSVDEGYVISTDPDVGSTVEYGSTVTIVVSNGPATASIPYVVGESYADAKEELEDAGFEVSLSEGSTSGTVLSQSQTGTATIGTTITLTTESEEDIPYIVGESYADAKKELEDAGFEVSLSEGSTSGTVLSQSQTGTALPGTTITLTTTEPSLETEEEEESVDTDTSTETDTSTDTDTSTETDTSTDSTDDSGEGETTL